MRTEDYDSFGRVTTPKLGVVYEITADVELKASWGKSFKAPTLNQRYQDRDAYLWTAVQAGGVGYPANATVLMSSGGNEDLDAERAESWTASLGWHPQSIPELNVDLSYFQIDYSDRVIQPLQPTVRALSDPNNAQFIHYSPTAQEQAALLAEYADGFYNYAEADYDPANVIAIGRKEYTNAARQFVEGVDLAGSYRIDFAAGQLDLRGAVSWLQTTQQSSARQEPFNLAGTVYNPANWSGRAGAVWVAQGLSVGGFVNYSGGITSKLTGRAEQTASFTTFDMTMRYAVAESDSLLSGFAVSLSVDNLFDRDPPLLSVPYTVYVPYDSTNYSAIGRYVSIALSKHW